MRVLLKLLQAFCVQMIVMAMRDKNVIRFGHPTGPTGQGREVLKPEKTGQDGINQKVTIHILDHDTGMCDKGQGAPLVRLDRIPININRSNRFLGKYYQ